MYGIRLAAVGLAAALAITGCAPATASATRPAAAARPTATTGTASEKGTAGVHMMIYSVNSDGPYFRAILTGAVGDYGPAVRVPPDGTVDPEHTSQMELRLTRGSFRLSIAGLDAKIAEAFRSDHPGSPRNEQVR